MSVGRISSIDGTLLGMAAIVIGGAAAAGLIERGERRMYRDLRRRVVHHLRGVSSAFYIYRLPEVLLDAMRSMRQVPSTLGKRVAPAVNAAAEVLVLLAASAYVDRTTGIGFAAWLAVWGSAVTLLSFWRMPIERRGKPVKGEDVAYAQATLDQPARTKLGNGPEMVRIALAGQIAHRQLIKDRIGVAPALLSDAPFALAFGCILVALWRAHNLSPRPCAGLILLGAALGFAAKPFARLRGVLGGLRHEAFPLRDVLDEPLETPCGDNANIANDKEQQGELARAGASIFLESVTFGFNPAKPPLSDVSLHIMPGEHVGITGASGGGKSTLTELMTGWHAPWPAPC